MHERDLPPSDSTDRTSARTLSRRTVALGLGGAAATLGALAVLGLRPDGATPQAVAQESAEFPLEDLLQTGELKDMTLGNADAPVTIIEYASMTCGHCGRFHRDVYPKLKEKYVDTGKVRFVFREFPLENYAAAASMLARCVPEDKFFPFVDLLFKTQGDWAYVPGDKRVETLFELAKQAGFTKERFEACLRDQKLLDNIRWIQNRGRDVFGVASTPTFFINGKMLRGGNTLETFEEMIAPFLES